MNKRNKIFKILIIVLVVFIMTGCESVEMNTSSCLKCGDAYFPRNLVVMVSSAINFIKIIVPTIIIIAGMVSLIKAVIASDEKQMEEAKKSLIRKFIAGIMIFLVIAIVQLFFNLVPDYDDGIGFDAFECLGNFISGIKESTPCPDRVTGKGVPMWDDEKGYKAGVNDDDDYVDCSDSGITNRDDCNSLGCNWNEDEKYCKFEDTKETCNCYVDSETGKYQWVAEGEQIPSGGSYKFVFKANCSNKVKCEQEKIKCWSCSSLSRKYVWNKSKPNTNCQEIISVTKSECSESELSKTCWKCYIKENNKTTIEYEWLKNNPFPSYTTSGSYCESTNLNFSQCKNMKSTTVVEKCYKCEITPGTITYIWGEKTNSNCEETSISKDGCGGFEGSSSSRSF